MNAMQYFFSLMVDVYNTFDSIQVPGLNISIMQFAIAMVSIAIAVGILIKIAPAGVNFYAGKIDSYGRNVKSHFSSRRSKDKSNTPAISTSEAKRIDRS